MTKPEWLKEKEAKRNKPEPNKCCDCVYFYGEYKGCSKHLGKEHCEVWECQIHPGCLNTCFSYSCEDWMCASVI